MPLCSLPVAAHGGAIRRAGDVRRRQADRVGTRGGRKRVSETSCGAVSGSTAAYAAEEPVEDDVEDRSMLPWKCWRKWQPWLHFMPSPSGNSPVPAPAAIGERQYRVVVPGV